MSFLPVRDAAPARLARAPRRTPLDPDPSRPDSSFGAGASVQTRPAPFDPSSVGYDSVNVIRSPWTGQRILERSSV